MSAQSGSASGSTPLSPDEYESLIERLRDIANAVIPRNATVLVVSRGDDELLHIGPRRGLHFPQDEFGAYRGYHPEDSDAAIAMLESMRVRGADYLLLPNTSFWWLDYYDGFKEHLEGNYSQIVSDEDCMLFELVPTGVQTPVPGADTEPMSAATSRRLAGPLDDLLRALLPADAPIAVVTAGDPDLPSFPDSIAVQAPNAATEAQFLVIPANDEAQPNGRPESIEGWTLVTHQRYLGEVYERAPFAVRRSPETDEGRSANDDRSTANEGIWHRLRNLFRR